MTNDESLLKTAVTALRQYGIENAELKRLGGYDNVNFSVDHQEKTYVLRLRISERHTKAKVGSELIWLDALRNDTNLNVPAPILNLNNHFITTTALNDRNILCTLMTWIKGKVPPTIEAMSEKQIKAVGEIMATLHQHSGQLLVPNNFERDTFGEELFRQRLEALSNALEASDLNAEMFAEFKSLANQVMTQFSKLTPDDTPFGLIHADFHSGNYLIDEDEVHIIDFDSCGFGFHLYDLALALMELEESKRKFFLAGYECVQLLPNGYEKFQNLFLSIAFIDNLGFFAPDPEELPFIVAELPLVLNALRSATSDMP